MTEQACEFVDNRLHRCPPDRAGAVPYGQAGENALRFPHLAHRSAAAHKLHSATATSRIEFDSGKGETLQPATGLSLFFPEPVQTTGTTAIARGRDEILPGMVGLLPLLMRLAPSYAARRVAET